MKEVIPRFRLPGRLQLVRYFAALECVKLRRDCGAYRTSQPDFWILSSRHSGCSLVNVAVHDLGRVSVFLQRLFHRFRQHD